MGETFSKGVDTKTAAAGGGIVPLKCFDAAKVGILRDSCKENGEKVRARHYFYNFFLKKLA